MSQQVLVNNKRKYTDILEELVAKRICRVQCKLKDITTITHGVKTEKVKWKKASKWPSGQALKIDIVDEENYQGLTFRMILDTTVNNL
jgi:hypothetical protein